MARNFPEKGKTGPEGTLLGLPVYLQAAVNALSFGVLAFLFLRDHKESSDNSGYPAPDGQKTGKHDRSGFFVHNGGRGQDECQDQAANVHGDLQV